MNQNKKILLIILLFFSIYNNAQKSNIILTSTKKNGDCVSARIYVTKSEIEKNIDIQKCQNQNKGNQSAIDICIENIKNQSDTDAITSYCGDGKYYIGINNKVFELKRIGNEPQKYSYFIGKFKVNKFIVTIKKVKDLLVEYQENMPTTTENVINYSCEVKITITNGSISKTLIGKTSEGI